MHLRGQKIYIFQPHLEGSTGTLQFHCGYISHSGRAAGWYTHICSKHAVGAPPHIQTRCGHPCGQPPNTLQMPLKNVAGTTKRCEDSLKHAAGTPKIHCRYPPNKPGISSKHVAGNLQRRCECTQNRCAHPSNMLRVQLKHASDTTNTLRVLQNTPRVPENRL